MNLVNAVTLSCCSGVGILEFEIHRNQPAVYKWKENFLEKI